ncbi:HTH_48 domain-containing protein [Trichonephila clavipes]|nr:HTH_48 domain-containing protein [Trichonephila clavipes]
MGEYSKTSRDAIGSSDWDRIMRGRPHAQERAKALIKSGSPYEDRMAFTLQNSTIEEQRSVIRFLTTEGEKQAAIHRQMVTVYGEKCVSDKSIRKWSARFRAGRESVDDDQRPGQANTVITSDLIDEVDDLVFAAWVPRQLTDHKKELHMGLALRHLFWYQEDPAFMKRIIAGGETWCHHYEPETKWDNMQWKHASSPPLKSSEL